MTSPQLVSGSAGDMADSVPELAALSLADRRAAMGTVMVDLNWGDPENDEVPGGPHIIRRRAEKILTPEGRGPLEDPQRVSEALIAAADAFELADLTRGQL